MQRGALDQRSPQREIPWWKVEAKRNHQTNKNLLPQRRLKRKCMFQPWLWVNSKKMFKEDRKRKTEK